MASANFGSHLAHKGDSFLIRREFAADLVRFKPA